jgi:hypothetical protein
MPITAAELILRSSANDPSDDTSLAGGAISTTSRPDLTQWSANAVAAVISDGADTRTVTITGRLATGVIDTEVLTLTGAVEVVGAKTWERVLSAVASATSGTRTVSVRQGSGGTVRATISINETTRHILFRDSTSEASEAVRFAKVFSENTNGTLTLTSAAVKLTADPAARIKIGLAPTKGDTATTTNRKTAPGGITFSDDNVSLGVPTGNLAAGEEIGIWIEQRLPANDPPNKSTMTIETSGSSV